MLIIDYKIMKRVKKPTEECADSVLIHTALNAQLPQYQ